MFIKLILVIFMIVLVRFSNGARILTVSSVPSYSHHILFNRIWKELSLRGHQITSLTTDPLKDTNLINLTEIDLSCSNLQWNEFVHHNAQANAFKFIYNVLDVFTNLADKQLSHPEVQNLINNNTEHFDLVIAELGPLSMYTFAKRFNCPMILISPVDVSMDVNHFLGNPEYSAIYPDFMLQLPEELSLFDRMYVATYWIYRSFLRVVHVHKTIPLIEKHFGYGNSELQDSLNRFALAFVNSDQIFYKSRALIPAIVQIGGGIHKNSSKELPKDLKLRLDAAKDGFIYFSLGSNMKSKYLPVHVRNCVLETFAELPYLIIWKFEGHLVKKPSNVLTSEWFPQQDILKHAHIKLFITQGSLQSIDEATYSRVPMVGIPFFADQYYNIKRIAQKDMGLLVDYKALNKTILKSAILEVVNNPKYRAKVMEWADLREDQPMTGTEKAVWWTEYVIRHNGSNHLRSLALEIPFYQYYCLDVITCFVAVLIILFLVIKNLIRLITSLLFRFARKIKTN